MEMAIFLTKALFMIAGGICVGYMIHFLTIKNEHTSKISVFGGTAFMLLLAMIWML
jgi:hypothetical protein